MKQVFFYIYYIPIAPTLSKLVITTRTYDNNRLCGILNPKVSQFYINKISALGYCC